MESNCQSSVQALPRQFGDLDQRLAPLPFSKTERSITRFDGGSEIDMLREEASQGTGLTPQQQHFLDTESEEVWKRPKLSLVDARGEELPEQPVAEPLRRSVYGKRLDEFAVSRCPSYRRHGALHPPCQENVGSAPSTGCLEKDASDGSATQKPNEAMCAAEWEKLFSEDILELAREILVHICGESCYKYSGARVQHICRHGYYYVVSLADYRRRRKGKPLRNVLFVIKQTKFGMEGRVMLFQEHPFECQSNYAGIGSVRCNLDVQDLRRVLSPAHWLEADQELPHLGPRGDWGYMNVYEWDGEEYVPRRAESSYTELPQQNKWEAELRPDEWRDIFLKCSSGDVVGEGDPEIDDIVQQMKEEATASFSDGLNTGFYINAYTTKQCPTMDGVLEEMRRGLERLQQNRETEQQKIREEIEKQGLDADKHLTAAERKALKGRSPFAHTMDVLKRLSASYRRCYWKSGAEMLFPILFGHMTFASHRCWTVFIKKAVFLASEAWRGEYGNAVRHAALKDGGGEVVQYIRAGMDAYPLVGWKKVVLHEGGAIAYEGPHGEVYEDLQQVYEQEVAAKAAQRGMSENRLALTFLQKFLTECCSEQQHKEEDGSRVVVTTSTLED
jgi:hypothetical protein